MDVRRRTADGRGLADIRLVRVEDGPGRGQRLLIVRNAMGIGYEIALDRGSDISSLTWCGTNIGWNSANGLPFPRPIDLEDGLGIYRNLDGFLFTCGLDHFGAPSLEQADHFIHKHRKQVFHPLHGRISSQTAQLTGYGIDWTGDAAVIWSEAILRQSSVFGENLVLRRRIETGVFGHSIQIDDVVENQGFRPTPHAILYHINFGHAFLDETTRLAGDLDPAAISAFAGEDKRPRDDFVDHYKDVPIVSDSLAATIEISNAGLSDGLCVRLKYSLEALPAFGIWKAYQSGIYALALEPARRAGPNTATGHPGILRPGEIATYRISVEFHTLKVIEDCTGAMDASSKRTASV